MRRASVLSLVVVVLAALCVGLTTRTSIAGPPGRDRLDAYSAVVSRTSWRC